MKPGWKSLRNSSLKRLQAAGHCAEAEDLGWKRFQGFHWWISYIFSCGFHMICSRGSCFHVFFWGVLFELLFLFVVWLCDMHFSGCNFLFVCLWSLSNLTMDLHWYVAHFHADCLGFVFMAFWCLPAWGYAMFVWNKQRWIAILTCDIQTESTWLCLNRLPWKLVVQNFEPHLPY